MTDREIKEKYDRMYGDDVTKTRILKSMTGKSAKEIHDILTEQAAAELTRVYHADENPYCTDIKTEPSEIAKHGRDIPEDVLNVLFNELDRLEAEIKEADKHKEKLEKRFTALVEYIGGTA